MTVYHMPWRITGNRDEADTPRLAAIGAEEFNDLPRPNRYFGFPHVPDLRQLQSVEQCRALLAECCEDFSAVVADVADEFGISIGRGGGNYRMLNRHRRRGGKGG